MTDYKILVGILATAVGVIGYVPYFWGIFKRTTKPHAFSWFVWGLLHAIAFFAQISKGGGAGTWVTGVTAIGCFLISFLALRYGERKIALIDWLSLFGALMGLVLWVFTSDPLLAILLITIIDAAGFIPTFRKGYLKPYEEGMTTFALGTLKFALGIVALQSLNLTTALFPVSLVVTCGSFVIMLALRRRSLGRAVELDLVTGKIKN